MTKKHYIEYLISIAESNDYTFTKSSSLRDRPDVARGAFGLMEITEDELLYLMCTYKIVKGSEWVEIKDWCSGSEEDETKYCDLLEYLYRIRNCD